MDFEAIITNIPLYLDGLITTVQLVAISLVLGLVLAIPVGVLASSKSTVTQFLPKAFIYFFRGTPLIVQMYMIYYGAGQFEPLRDSIFWPIFKQAYSCALIAFSLNTAAYTAEILRGAIIATHFGEIEAARACGMSKWLVLRRIVLPSAFRRALPAYGNEVIFMLHGSALAGVITIIDLFGAARIVNSRFFVPFESFITAGVFYLALTFMIIWVFKKMEFRWHAHLHPRKS